MSRLWLEEDGAEEDGENGPLLLSGYSKMQLMYSEVQNCSNVLHFCIVGNISQ